MDTPNHKSIEHIVTLTKEPIELYKILKFEGFAASGGEAKAAIAAGSVSVNGAVELQQRKKIVSGDTIELGGVRLLIDSAVHPSRNHAG